MKVVNNTTQTISLVNGKKLGKYKSITVQNPSQELIEQLENLQKIGLVQAYF